MYDKIFTVVASEFTYNETDKTHVNGHNYYMKLTRYSYSVQNRDHILNYSLDYELW